MTRVRLFEFWRSGTLRFAVLWLFGFGALALVVPTTLLIEIGNAVIIAVSVTIMVTYAPAVYAAVTTSEPSGQDYFMLGIWLLWAHSFLLRCWALLFRTSGRPDWMLDDPLLALFMFLGVMAGALHVTAPGAANGIIPKRNWVIWGGIVGVAVAGAILVSWRIEQSRIIDLIP